MSTCLSKVYHGHLCFIELVSVKLITWVLDCRCSSTPRESWRLLTNPNQSPNKWDMARTRFDLSIDLSRISLFWSIPKLILSRPIVLLLQRVSACSELHRDPTLSHSMIAHLSPNVIHLDWDKQVKGREFWVLLVSPETTLGLGQDNMISFKRKHPLLCPISSHIFSHSSGQIKASKGRSLVTLFSSVLYFPLLA